MSLAGRDLTIGYSDRVVGRGLDVALEQGEVLALLGPNGGGKTTLLKTLLGILNPQAGEVAIGGRSLAAISIRERAQADRLCAAGARADLRLHGRERGADGPHRPRQPVQPAVGARPHGGGARARAVRHRASGDASLHHDLRRRAPARAARPRAGAGAAIRGARRADREPRLRQPGQGHARDPRARRRRPRRALHHPRSQPRAARRRPRLSAARGRAHRRRRRRRACSPARSSRSSIARRSRS